MHNTPEEIEAMQKQQDVVNQMILFAEKSKGLSAYDRGTLAHQIAREIIKSLEREL